MILEITRAIDPMPIIEQSRMYNEINCWGWPEELPPFKSGNYGHNSYNSEDKEDIQNHKIARFTMDYILKKHRTYYHIFKYNHMVNIKRTEEQFDDWWINSGMK